MSQLYPNWDNVQPCRELDELVAYFLGWKSTRPGSVAYYGVDETGKFRYLPNWCGIEYAALQIWKLMPDELFDKETWWSIHYNKQIGRWETVLNWTKEEWDSLIWSYGSLTLAICVAFCKAKSIELNEASGV